jgi:tripartite ATP-independent transporter DctM subunit
MEWIAILMFLVVVAVLLFGYPVAFSLGGVALFFAFIGSLFGIFDIAFLGTVPNRLFGIMNNETLMAVPLFVFMGITLEKAKIAEELLEDLSKLFGQFRGGLGISVTVVGMLLAASTGIVGATVVTMGLLSLPSMLKRGYDPKIATGTICASGTLGQIIPPSIVLVLLGDVLSSAYSQAQLDQGIFSPDTVSVGDLFVGSLIPGLGLVFLYIIYILGVSIVQPQSMPTPDHSNHSGHKLFNTLSLSFSSTASDICGAGVHNWWLCYPYRGRRSWSKRCSIAGFSQEIINK